MEGAGNNLVLGGLFLIGKRFSRMKRKTGRRKREKKREGWMASSSRVVGTH